MDTLHFEALVALCACDVQTLKIVSRRHLDYFDEPSLKDVLLQRYGSWSEAKQQLGPVYQRLREAQSALDQHEEQQERDAAALCQRQMTWLEQTRPHLDVGYEVPDGVTVLVVDRENCSVYMEEVTFPFVYSTTDDEWRGTHVSRFALREQADGSFVAHRP